MKRKQASDFDQELLNLYDDYAHGRIHRRGFLEGAAKFAVGGLTAEALLSTLSPNYAWAQQVAKDDPRLKTEYLEYASPKGAGKMRGYLVRPASASGKLPAVVVVHENRGLNPYIEDVTRRLGIAGFLALAPDALTPLGGYPGNDDQGREMQSTQIRSIDLDATRLWVIQPEDQTRERRLAAACATEQSQHGTRLQVEREAAQDRIAPIV